MARYFGFDPVQSGEYYFISYNSADAGRVGVIAREMHARGIPLWYDRGLMAGEEWEKQIAVKIRNCREMVMFVTKKLMARENPYVRKEYSLAVKNHKKVHVIYLDTIDFESVNVALQGWFVGLEYLHGIQAFQCASVVEIVDTMDDGIHFIKSRREQKPQPKPIAVKENKAASKPNQSAVKKAKSKPAAASKPSFFKTHIKGIAVVLAIMVTTAIGGVVWSGVLNGMHQGYTANDSADTYYTYDVTDQGVTITGFSDKDVTELVIPAEMEGKPVTEIGAKTFIACTSLKSVTLPDDIIIIGDFAFSGCTTLSSVKIPSGVTRIGCSAFESCTSLDSIEIPGSVTEIGFSAFSYCTSLQSVEIPDSVTMIYHDAFRHCTALTTIEIPNSVTVIGADAFSGCTALTTMEIPNSVNRIGDSAFSYCNLLDSITIPDSVIYISDSSFKNCYHLTIHAKSDSYAASYAKEHNIPFAAI